MLLVWAGRYEGLFTLVVSPRCEAGKYFVKDGIAGDVNEPWGRYFNAFTPSHGFYYFVGIARSFTVLCGLNFLKPWPAAQSSFVCFIEGVTMAMALKNAPYVNLAQSRTDLVASVQRFGVFFLASLPFVPDVPMPGGGVLKLSRSPEEVCPGWRVLF